MDSLFGTEMPLAIRFIIAFVVVLVLIGVAAWLVRKFGSDRLGGGANRGRQPRLAVIDAASVDSRRRLVLICRDNVEHLLIIGGPTDVVVEQNIVRAAPVAARDTVAVPRVAEPRMVEPIVPSRPAPSAETTSWPLQPQSEPAPRPRSGLSEDAVQWPLPAEPGPRTARAVDPLAGLSTDLPRTPPDLSRASAEPLRAPAVILPEPAPAPDASLTDMATRLEAALRRPGTSGASNPSPAPNATNEQRQPSDQIPSQTPNHAPAVSVRSSSPVAAAPSVPGPAPMSAVADIPMPTAADQPMGTAPEVKPPRAEGKPAPKTMYDSLEQEMASLLSRPPGKT